MNTNEHYIRDINGKEITIYTNSSLDQWNIFGKDNAGKVEENNIPYFYLKDHLGSIRVVVDSGRTVVASQDFDMWGYTMTDRTYNITNAKYDFTGKERDTESGLDYFGARYLHSRIGRWTSTDPLFEKHFDYNPYNYVLNNTIVYYDPDGRQRNAIMKMQPMDDGGGGIGTLAVISGAIALRQIMVQISPDVYELIHPIQEILVEIWASEETNSQDVHSESPDFGQSKTLWEDPQGKGRIDIERKNPKDPNSKPDIHYQNRDKYPDRKFRLDLDKNKWFDKDTGKEAPKSLRRFLEKNKGVKKAIEKAKKYLNIE